MNAPKTSSYLEQPLRPLSDVITARARDDHAKGLKIHQSPFVTPRLMKLWQSGWLLAEGTKPKPENYRNDR